MISFSARTNRWSVSLSFDMVKPSKGLIRHGVVHWKSNDARWEDWAAHTSIGPLFVHVRLAYRA